MRSVHRYVVGFAFLITIATIGGFAQGPPRTKLMFTMNVPYVLKLGDYVLPAGKYVLYESSTDSNRFALHPQNLSKEPIAQIYTTRAMYWTVPRHRETKLLLDIQETRGSDYPVLAGWNVPYADAWNVVRVVANGNRVLTKVN